MSTPDEIEQMLADCEARESRLTDWERGFIDSIRNSFDVGRGLTEKQDDALERIWNKVME